MRFYSALRDTKWKQTTLLVFLLIQLLIIGTAAATFSWRWHALSRKYDLPPLRAEPLSSLIEPKFDLDVVVTDDQLVRVLRKLRPRDLGSQSKINHIDHALRFWGPDAVFDDPAYLSSHEMIRRLTDHRRFEELYGKSTQCLLIDGPDGVAVRVQSGIATSSHVDHTLASLAEIGTLIDFQIFSPAGPQTYRALLNHSLKNFSLNQAEYEWSILAYSLFLPPCTDFITREGQRVDFDMLADRLLRETLPLGVCFGNHRLHTLVMLLRVNEHQRILREDTVDRIHGYLLDVTARLVRSQHPDGYWDAAWSGRVADKAADPSNPFEVKRDRLLATGHAMEWWALSPAELHPPRYVLAAAGQWLVRTIDELSEPDLLESYTFLTHAGRALALWRGYSYPTDVPGVTP